MHGRHRAEYKALQRDAKVVAKLSAKAVAWHQLQAALLQRRATTDATTLGLIEKAVTVNPDPIWLWNVRRDLMAVCSKHSETNETNAAMETADQIWEREQTVTQTALMGNPKAYAAWHHRKCCLQTYLISTTKDPNQPSTDRVEAVLQFELGLTATLFQRDERNFHCWSYRRFIVSCRLWYVQQALGSKDEPLEPPNGEWKLDHALDRTVWMGAQVATTSTKHFSTRTTPYAAQVAVDAILYDEWNFCGAKIRDNFSNCSAFHYRSKLLPLMVDMVTSTVSSASSAALIESLSPHGPVTTTTGHIPALVALEMELVANAIFTEPDDQTAWWYQYFLLDFILDRSTRGDDTNWYLDHLLQPHTDQLRELREETQSRSKWVLIGLEQCLDYSQRLSEELTLTAERQEILEALLELDSDRHHRYRYMLQQL